jgi:hypothetical protein
MIATAVVKCEGVKEDSKDLEQNLKVNNTDHENT